MMIRKRWLDLLNSAAKSTKKTRTLLTPIGATFFLLFTTFFAFATILVDRLLGLPRLLPEVARLGVSLPVMAFGAALAAWSVIQFLKVRGTPVPFNPPPKLVRTGPYRYMRNPMLAGIFVLLFGVGLCINSFSLVTFFLPLYVVLNVWELKEIEEPELIKRLGDEYIAYREHTPMFIPHVKMN